MNSTLYNLAILGMPSKLKVSQKRGKVNKIVLISSPPPFSPGIMWTILHWGIYGDLMTSPPLEKNWENFVCKHF